MNKLFLASLLFLIVGALSVSANIDKCMVISLSGHYDFNASFVANTESSCLNITASNVYIDGNGFVFTGAGDLTAGTIFLNGVKNVTVDNLVINNSVIYLYAVNDSSFLNLIFYNSTLYGEYRLRRINLSDSTFTGLLPINIESIWASDTLNLVLSRVNISNTAGGAMYFDTDTINLTLSNCDIFQTSFPAAVNDEGLNLPGISGLFISSTSIHGFGSGIEFGGSANNVQIHDSKVYANDFNGFDIWGTTFGNSAKNTIYNVTFNNSDNILWSNIVDRANNWNVSLGNKWFNPSTSGYSETCVNLDSNDICDVAYDVLNDGSCVMNCSSNTDYLSYALYDTTVLNITSYVPTNLTPTFVENITVLFNMSVDGGTTPYSFEWFLDGISQAATQFWLWVIGYHDDGNHTVVGVVTDDDSTVLNTTWDVTVEDTYV